MAGGSYELVQPIVVTGNGTHEDTVRAVAMASVQAMLQLDGPWAEWLDGPFAKTVRRVKNDNQLRRVADDMEVLGHRSFRYGCGGPFAGTEAVYAVAFGPLPAVDLPRPVARLQVSGLDRPRTGRWTDPSPTPVVVVCINADIEMTTGKTAAQAAHALMAWLLGDDAPLVLWDDFELGNVSFLLREVPQTLFDRLWLHAGDAAIADNGHTEVEPGTRTALAVSPSIYERVMTDGEE